eukprot:CAMPEP_0197516462 /NCGR_PEP_ID=MMETSP1318-20131121/1333_1 /TAXON_ID=552666 /ORGANISM="Partenskyella glossopodia, Strain RCC365" /LENGTH=846 /DNA_ID=CAMNT_0043065217 /DNA_START=30 /DNA_END=2570 /DNA_ORIENTATION=+
MSAIAFDIGDSFCKIGMAKNNKISVMQNQVGKRKTGSVVAFSAECRVFDTEAAAQQMSNSKNTSVGFKGLIAKKISDPAVAEEKKYVNQTLVETKDGKIGLQVKYLGKDATFTPTQIMTSLLTFLKDQAEKGLGSSLPETVLGCPPWWTEAERTALLDAAGLAGIKVLRIMNETTAVALDYGINLSIPDGEKRKSLFIDVGHSNVNVSMVEFWKKSLKDAGLKVLATASARGVGGRSFNTIIEKYFAEMILKKYKLDVMSQAKPRQKLIKACEKVKTNLTANNKVPFGVEYMMDDTDVSGSIDRKDFEAAAAPVLQQILAPIAEVMKATGVTASELSTIEVVGGGSRIPCVKKAIKEFLGRDLSFHCDADESCAKGLVLQAAMLSPSFRTRNYQVEDISPYPIEVAWGPVGFETPEKDHKAAVFSKNNPVPSVKAISFTDRSEPFQLTASYMRPGEMPPCPTQIGRYIIKGFPKKFVGEKIKVKVWMKLGLHGTVEVQSAALIETLPEEEEKTDMEVEKTADEASKKEEAKKEEKNEEGAAESKTEESKTEEAKSEESKKEAPAPDAAKKPEKKKKKTRRTELKVESHNLSLDKNDFKNFEQVEATMINTDKVVAETAAARNDLETYTLEMRSNIQGDLKSYIKADDAEKFLEELQNMEDWIYDEGYDAQKSTIIKKLDQLKLKGDPLFKRKYEYAHGSDLIQRLKVCVGKYRQLATSGDKKYAHIEAEKMDSVVKKCEEIDVWATQTGITLGNSPHHTDPPILCSGIKAKQEELVSFAQPILSTPAPKPKKEEKKEEAKKEDAKKEEANKAEEAKAEATTEEPVKMDTESKDQPTADAADDMDLD